MKPELSPFFAEILNKLITFLEKNLQSGKYVDCETSVTQEVRDGYLAVELLKAFGSNAELAIPVLVKLLAKDIHWWFPHIVADTLGEIGLAAEVAIPRLACLMLSEQDAPRSDYGHYSAANALGRIGSAKAVPYLIKAAQDSDEQGPGFCAIRALSLLGSKAKDALPILKQLRKDPKFYDYWNSIESAINSISSAQT
jgi:HEAT repeat protein